MKLSFKKGGAAAGGVAVILAMATPFIGKHEGLRLAAYRDIAGIPTICYGETLNVKMGDRKSKEQCDAMLQARVKHFYDGVNRCVTRPLPTGPAVAFTSFAYNGGSAGFCGSSMARLWNAGQWDKSCDALRLWNKARVNGKFQPVKGLTKRREEERAICLMKD